MTKTDIELVDGTSTYKKLKPIRVGDKFDSRYGEIIVVAYDSANSILVEFVNTGLVKKCQASALRNGKVKDNTAPSSYGVGYIGIGDHVYISNYVESPAAIKWKNMLKRCYSTDPEEARPSYSCATVCAEWQNFQIFAEWFVQQPNNSLGFDLEKDVRPFLRGESPEKIYSCSNCTLLPRSINAKLANLQKRLSQSAKARSVHPAHAVLPTGINFDKSHRNFRIFVNGGQVATRKRLAPALEIYERLSIEHFVKELEAFLSVLHPLVVEELEGFKNRIGLNS